MSRNPGISEHTAATGLNGPHFPSVHIEQAGIEPVPKNLKTVGFIDQFFIFVNFLINPTVMIHGGSAVAMGLSFKAACLAVGLGTLSALVPYTMITRIGVDYGIPGQVAARMSFGIRGAQLIPSAARSICSIYFFALNTIIGLSFRLPGPICPCRLSGFCLDCCRSFLPFWAMTG